MSWTCTMTGEVTCAKRTRSDFARRVLIPAVACVVGVTGTSEAEKLAVVPVVTGLNRAVYCVGPPNDPTRLMIVEKRGVIKVLNLVTGELLPEPFLDIQEEVADTVFNNDERGLLGMAFHPNYPNDRSFFVNYVDTTKPFGATVVARFQVSDDLDRADPDIKEVIFTVPQPEINHNGGCLQFGPDGMLYVGMGDGGGANDAHGSIGNGQALDTLLGKMLRFDIDRPPPHIPDDNPFVGPDDPLDEIWAVGLRHPWRFSFDRNAGDLYIADVGQFAQEEVNFIPANAGGGQNFGWRCMEGDACFTSPSGPNCVCMEKNLTMPALTYAHTGNPVRCAIIGGYVYRGQDLPGERGNYFFGDWCSGEIWSLRMVNGLAVDIRNRTPELGTITSPASFGEDARGELYIVRQTGTASSQVLKIVADDPACHIDADCTDADPCTQNACTEGDCRASLGTFGDVTFDGGVDVIDIFCVLDGILGNFQRCPPAAIDIANCVSDGKIDFDDLAAVLDAFRGIDPCCD